MCFSLCHSLGLCSFWDSSLTSDTIECIAISLHPAHPPWLLKRKGLWNPWSGRQKNLGQECLCIVAHILQVSYSKFLHGSSRSCRVFLDHLSSWLAHRLGYGTDAMLVALFDFVLWDFVKTFVEKSCTQQDHSSDFPSSPFVSNSKVLLRDLAPKTHSFSAVWWLSILFPGQEDMLTEAYSHSGHLFVFLWLHHVCLTWSEKQHDPAGAMYWYIWCQGRGCEMAWRNSGEPKIISACSCQRWQNLNQETQD